MQIHFTWIEFVDVWCCCYVNWIGEVMSNRIKTFLASIYSSVENVPPYLVYANERKGLRRERKILIGEL